MKGFGTMEKKEDWLDRRTHPLPKVKCYIRIVLEFKLNKWEEDCVWTPDSTGSPTYSGSARQATEHMGSIVFCAFENSERDFIYYKILHPYSISCHSKKLSCSSLKESIQKMKKFLLSWTK